MTTAPLDHVTIVVPTINHQALVERVSSLFHHGYPAKVRKGSDNYHDERIRRTRSLRILDEIPDITRILEHVYQSRRVEICDKLGVTPFKEGLTELGCLAYVSGDHFARHRDVIYGRFKRRRLSWVYYFYQEPRAFTGGDLILYPNGSQCTVITPQSGMMVFFAASTAHEVQKVDVPGGDIVKSRFAITGFINEKPNFLTATIWAKENFASMLNYCPGFKSVFKGILKEIKKFR